MVGNTNLIISPNKNGQNAFVSINTTKMKFLIFLVVAVLLFQIGLFFLIRYRKKKEKESSVIEKYNIRTAKDAWDLLSDPDLPEDDREKIQKLYQGEEEA